MTAKRVTETFTRMAQIMTPNDANVLGNVFGGSILSLIDLTASATSQKFSGHVCVTASFDRVDFHEPIEVGELVELEGVVTYAGRTSVEVTIQVYATTLTKGERRHSNTARVTMVALADGRPTPVPKLICETRDEKLQFLLGQCRRELRQRRLVEMEAMRQRLEDESEDSLDRLLSDKIELETFLRSTIGMVKD